MSEVGAHIHRAVTNRAAARAEHAAKIAALVAELTAAADASALDVPADPTHTLDLTEGAPDANTP